MTTTLVIGGTGPTGPLVVEGLLARGHAVTVLHTGRHEVEYSAPVAHIHADPNFKEPLVEALGHATFDLAISMYGRLRITADVLRRRCDRVIGVGGVFYPGWVDGRLLVRNGGAWPEPSYTRTALPVPETTPLENSGRFSERAIESERLLMQWHHAGDYRATMLRYPQVYGPRQLAPQEWSIVRRFLDGRRRLLVPDGGLLLETRLYRANAAHMVLAAVDEPAASAGQTFNCGDAEPLTQRDWICIMAEALGVEVELVSVPFELAEPTFAYTRGAWRICHRVLDISKARQLLRYAPVPAAGALTATARWYADHPLERGGAAEKQLSDSFPYELEDDLIASIGGLKERFGGRASSTPYSHPYDHPTEPCVASG
jgi:nucleoside-diphosphate-sugar epimerase